MALGLFQSVEVLARVEGDVGDASFGRSAGNAQKTVVVGFHELSEFRMAKREYNRTKAFGIA